MQQCSSLTEVFHDPQVLIGIPVLVLLLVTFYKTGRLRHALCFPPLVQNHLNGGHLLYVLITFLLILQISTSGLSLLGYISQSPASQPAAATAPSTSPVDAEGEPADAARSTQSVETPGSSLATQPAVTQPVAPPASQGVAPAPEMHDEPIRLAVQAAAELLTICLMLGIARITFADGLRGIGLPGRSLLWAIGWAILAYLAFWPVCDVVANRSTWLYERFVAKPKEHQVLQLLESPNLSLGWQMLAWFVAGLVAPVFEELFFRGMLLTWLRQVTRSTWLAIVLSGLAFGVIHMPQWHLVPALSLLGLLLGYLYARTGSLTLVIFFHIIFNLRTLVMLEIAGKQ